MFPRSPVASSSGKQADWGLDGQGDRGMIKSFDLVFQVDRFHVSAAIPARAVATTRYS